MKKIVFLLMLLLIAQMLIAEEQVNEKTGVTAANEILAQATTLPEIKLGYTRRYVFPFLQGETPLTKDNNIGLALSAEVSPVSVNGIAETIWTPIAFFQFAAGGRIGSGWNITLGENTIYGIGINKPDKTGKAENSGSPFDGLLWKVQTGAALQADLAAIVPGDWNHVVIRSYHEINYKGYSHAAAGESWYFEADDGENINGFNYYGNFLAGYQMPILLNLSALLTEMDLYLYDTPNRSNWGDEKIRWTFSAIFGFTFTERLGLNVLTQFRTRRNYLESNWEDLYYRNRTIDNSNPLRLEFYRVAAALTYKF